MRLWYGIALALVVGSSGFAFADDPLPRHRLPAAADGTLVVGLCDGETSVEVPGVKPGQSMTRAQAQHAADALMAAWRQKHPEAAWIVAEANGRPGTTAADAPAGGPGTAVAGANDQVQTYGAFTERDEKIWQASTAALIAEGKRIFHDAGALGSTDAISCDMCHPDAANTHPETYPKYQVQIGRVALLRDMINWCIENPVRGKPLADDDPKMKALEAYIISQRKGTPLDYGKH